MTTYEGRLRQALVASLVATAAGVGTVGSAEASPAKDTSPEIRAMKVEEATFPSVGRFTSAPLRNRMRVELRAPVSEVWALIGDIARFPEYSAGLARVDAKIGPDGTLAEYVCHFKPREEGGEGIAHREVVRWYEPNRGYASSGEEGNVFGLTNDLNLVLLEPWKEGTLLTFEVYYDAADLEMMRAEYDQAFADIGANLARRFGGVVGSRYVDR